MAEVVGLIASVTSLLDLTLKSSKALHNLQSQLRRAPDLIRALTNEAEDIKAVLARVEDTMRTSEAARLDTPSSATILADLGTQLDKAKAILTDLDALTQSLAAEAPTLRRVKWLLKKSQAAELQSDLKNVRTRINELQVSYSGSSSTRIELVLRDIQVVQHSQHSCLQATRNQLELARHTHADIAAALQVLLQATPSRTIDPRLPMTLGTMPVGQNLPAIEAEAEQRCFSSSASTSEALSQHSGEPAVASRAAGMGRPDFPARAEPSLTNSILLLTLGLMQSRCPSDCLCRCHVAARSSRSWSVFPGALQAITGSLFVGYAGLPAPSASCDRKGCSNGRTVRFSLTYGFPVWFLGYAVHMLVEASTAGFLTFALTPRHRISMEISESNILWQIEQGSLRGIERIIRANRAAVFDVYYSDDRSTLDFALAAPVSWERTLDMVKVLLQAGADLDQVNNYGYSARHNLIRMGFMEGLPPDFEQLFYLPECLDDLDLNFIHKIVTGRCPIDLAVVLKSGSPDILAQVNGRDRFGHTPLMYAAVRGDGRTVEALIDANASANELSLGGDTALSLAASLQAPSCLAITDMLLKAGADTNLANQFGENSLHRAARLSDPAIIERLLSVGAKLDSRTFDGRTPLACAAHSNSAEALGLLYEKGADINVLDARERTPLMIAITFNSHETQSVLLKLGCDYLRESRWGNILHNAADVGDEQTFRTLAGFKLTGLDRNARNSFGWTPSELFENRSEISGELRSAFYQLLNAVGSTQLSDEGEELSEADDEFVDASEFLGGNVLT